MFLSQYIWVVLILSWFFCPCDIVYFWLVYKSLLPHNTHKTWCCLHQSSQMHSVLRIASFPLLIFFIVTSHHWICHPKTKSMSLSTTVAFNMCTLMVLFLKQLLFTLSVAFRPSQDRTCLTLNNNTLLSHLQLVLLSSVYAYFSMKEFILWEPASMFFQNDMITEHFQGNYTSV